MNTGKQINAMVIVLFVALIAIGAYVIWDPFRSDAAEDTQLDTTVERGATTFALNCRLCHGDRGEGGAAGGRLGAAPPLDRADLQGIENGTFSQAAHDAAFRLVTNTITCGRAGRQMPTWGATQGGTLNEEQIRQLAVLITQGTLPDGRSTWELAQEHADEIDAEATGHAEIDMPAGLSADASELVVSDAELLNRDQFLRIDDERLYIPAYRLDVQRAANDTEAADHTASAPILEDGQDTTETLKLDTTAEDTSLYVSGIRGTSQDNQPQVEVGDTLQIDDEQVVVEDITSGIPTTGQVLVEGIGRTPKRFLVSGSDGIEAGAIVRLDGELLQVKAVNDDGEPNVELADDASSSSDTIAVSDPAFFNRGYVILVGGEQMRIVDPVDTAQTLGDTIGRAETTFSVSGSVGLDQGMVVRIDSELMRVTELTPATIVVDRGVALTEGGAETAAAPHSSGAPMLKTGVEEGEDPDTGQTLLEGVNSEGATFTVSGTTGLAVDQVFQIGDEGIRITDIQPAQVKVERAVGDTETAHHSRRASIYDGNLFTVDRGFDGTSAQSHNEGDAVLMFELEVDRAVEGTATADHAKNAELFLGDSLLVVRGVKNSEAADHEDGSPVRNFPLAPDNPPNTQQACGQVAAPEGPTPTAGPTPTPAAGAQQVAVSLIEFEVKPDPTSLVDGATQFTVANDGSVLHNFRVIASDLPADQLPISSGAVDEGQVDVVASIADFDAGQTQTTAVNLPPGSYVLICNVPGHYSAGMHAAFEVTAP